MLLIQVPNARVATTGAPTAHKESTVYSREYLGFLPLTLLPIVLGIGFIVGALLWGHAARPL